MEIFGQTITLSNRFKIISHSKKIKAIIALGPFSSLSSFLDLGMNVQGRRNRGRALCVEMGFTWTFPRNQDDTVKLKSELISIKF